MELKKGYKRTEVGIIPSDWEVLALKQVLKGIADVDHYMPQTREIGIPYIMTGDLKELVSEIDFDNCKKISIGDFKLLSKKIKNSKGDVILARYATIGTISYVDINFDFVVSYSCVTIKPNPSKLLGVFLFNYFKSSAFKLEVINIINANTQSNVGIGDLYTMKIALPPFTEQTVIATALSDADALISSLEKLIEKKRNIKQGAMQQLLKPKKGWMVKKLGEIVEVLDNLRVPLNDNQRSKMNGDIPYCGANGIVGFVNDYIIDDEIILIAEDGGFFDQYKTRPIAYRMSGKCWVNNHAHILKATIETDQDFLFYCLVNRNILDFINGGTRAKLNKGDLVNIDIFLPVNKIEQHEIATILTDIDKEIAALEKKLSKSKMLKEGMMQELLTGKIRLV